MVAKLSGTTQKCRALAAVALLFCMDTVIAQTTTQPSAGQLSLCMACHGPQGNSRISSIPSLAGQPKTFIENQLVLIREGIREVLQMKGMLDKITDEEFVSLANYFAAQNLVTANTSAVNNGAYLRGQEISKKMLCGTCHLPNYAGQNQIPRLAGQHEEFLVLSIKQFRDGNATGRDTNMTASVQGMKDSEIADVAHYLAQFK